MKQHFLTLSFVLMLCSQQLWAQGTVEDYRRAFSISNRYAWKMKNGDVRAHARRGEHRFWYSVYDGEKTVYKEVDAETGEVSLLPENPEKPRKWNRGPQRHWMEVPDERDGEVRTANGEVRIYHCDNNLWKNDAPLTTDGDSLCYYSAWGSLSPDERYLATVKIVPAPKHYVYYVESSPKEQLEPILHKQEYAKPGDSLNYRIPVIVELATGRVVIPSTDLFKQQYYVSAPRWDSNSRTVTFEFNERGHKTYRVLEMSAETGKVRTLIEETNSKYINYNLQRRIDLKDERHILWTSERDGRNHIYLYDRQKGKLVRQITKGEFYVRSIQHVDEEAQVIYFSANGRSNEDHRTRSNGRVASDEGEANGGQGAEDPYFIHYYKVKFDGSGLTCLTPEEGNHEATFTNDMRYLIDTYSTVTQPPTTLLRSGTDGTIIKTLEQADISNLVAQGWKAPEVFVAKGRDGKTDMWGLIQRPSNFDPTKKYPIIEYIYSGPGSQYVPKSFTPWLWNLADLAELGFIVVQLDAMTTSFRTREFEEVCYKNLADAGLPDRIAWIRAAAERYPYMDIDRVGIYGCSAGGQNALSALLFHGDFYKAGYAACGCHDNRMDKIWWNEQWMGYPVDSSYVRCSNLENAYRLERPLMLVVGEMDDNVDPASTMQVANALIRAGKDFELVVIPGAHHTMGESYGQHKRYDFFVRHLLHQEPPAWSDLQKKED